MDNTTHVFKGLGIKGRGGIQNTDENGNMIMTSNKSGTFSKILGFNTLKQTGNDIIQLSDNIYISNENETIECFSKKKFIYYP